MSLILFIQIFILLTWVTLMAEYLIGKTQDRSTARALASIKAVRDVE